MRLLFSLLTFYVVVGTFSQWRIDKFDFHELQQLDDTIRCSNYMRYYHTSILQSNYLTNQFEKEALEGEITDATKELIASNLGNNNLYFTLNDLGLDYQRYSENRSLYLTLGFRFYDFTSTSLPEGAVGVLLNGNAPYENQVLDLGTSIVERYRYQSLVLGLDKIITDKLLIGGRVHVIKGTLFRQVNIYQGYLYTHPDGVQIDLEVNYEDVSSRNSGTEISQFEGLGAAFNLYGKYELSERHSFSFEVDNLGFIRWDDQRRFATDSLVSYEGIDLLNDGGNTINGGRDINEILGLEETSADVFYQMPFSTHLCYQYVGTNKLMVSSGVKMYMFVKNYPQVYFRPGYKFVQKKGNQLSISAIFSAGGFSQFDAGLSCKLLYKNVYLNGDSFHLEKLFLPNSTSSGFSLTTGVFF